MSNNTQSTGGAKWKFIILGVVLGAVLFGSAAFTLHATDDRQFCSSCHAMQQQSVTHKASVHAKVACNECHLPQSLLPKLPTKAQYGARDVFHNMFGSAEDLVLIQASAQSKAIINTNCQNCHTQTNKNVTSMLSKDNCTDCHRNVAHMRMTPISLRMVGDE